MPELGGGDSRNANLWLPGSVSPYPYFKPLTSHARDFYYTPTSLIYPYKPSIYQYTKQKPTVSHETLLSPTITAPTLPPVGFLERPNQKYVKLFEPSHPTLQYPNNIDLTNNFNILCSTLSIGNNETSSNYMQPSNIVLIAQKSAPTSYNLITPTKSLANDNLNNPVRILSNGQIQSGNVSRPTENILNPFGSGIYIPRSTLRVSPNKPKYYLTAKPSHELENMIPSLLQSSDNIKQIPVVTNKRIKNNICNEKVSLQNIINRLIPKQGKHLQETKNFSGSKEWPFTSCKNCNCNVAKNSTIVDQIIKHLHDYSQALPDCKLYDPHTDDKITVPLSEIGLTKYVVTETNKNLVRTEIPGLFIKAWDSKIKIIKPKLVFDIEEYQGYNFIPIMKSHYYTPEFAQNVVKDIVTRLYGKPIVINGVYSTASPYAIIDDINNSSVKDGKAYILWPTLCNCGCMSSGCKCCFSQRG